MKKKTWINIVVYGVILIATAYFLPKEKNWQHSYSLRHNWPYGSEILHNHLMDLFPDQELLVNEESLYEIQNSLLTGKQSMIFICDYLQLDTLDLSLLLRHVSGGAEVFIAAQDLPYRLLDTLDIGIASKFTYSTDVVRKTNKDSIYYNFTDPRLKQKEDYLIFSEYQTYHFVPEDSTDQNLGLSYTSDSLAVFVSKDFGKGKFYLHSQPLAFTNYYMMRPDGRDYISKVFSYLRPNHLIWDEYYKKINEGRDQNKLRVIMAEAPLKWAYYLVILAGFLFVLFRIKRKQRVIPVIDQYPNESKDLVETIGTLYFNTSDNKAIAEKKIKLFYQQMQQRYRMRKDWSQEQQISFLKQKTGYPIDRLQRLFTLMSNVQGQKTVSDGQLKVLNKYINELKKV